MAARRKKIAAGEITWFDLTVIDAKGVRDFYRKVAGWKAEAVSMGTYSDWSMVAPSGKTVAGVCHARGPNRGLPPQWLLYITVPNLAKSLAACRRAGGKVVHGPREMGEARMAVVRDPAGAVVALFQPG